MQATVASNETKRKGNEIMSQLQNDLVARIEAGMKFTSVKWNGNFLNCVRSVEGVNGKPKPQKFSFVFDDAEICQGARLVQSSLKGCYSRGFAEDAFAIIMAFDADHKDTVVA